MLAFFAIAVIVHSVVAQKYPIYGTTKRYGTYMTRSWSPKQPQMVQGQYPINYYAIYPDNQNYPADYYYYYYPENYPIYYPKTSKYEVYQAVLPYYYEDDRNYENYYKYDDLNGEEDVEEREDNQPIGYETLYPKANGNDLMDRANAAFLQNLIASQIYQKNNKNDNFYDNYKNDKEDFEGYWDDYTTTKKPQFDDDVKELMRLKNVKNSGVQWLKNDPYRIPYSNEYKRSMKTDSSAKLSASENAVKIKIADRKPVISSTRKPTTGGNLPNGSMREEVMDRPATPVRQPFNKPLLDYMAARQMQERKRTPSVFDTIKQMLEMEKGMKNKEAQIRPPMKKRIISTEDNLTKQLTVLKKSRQ